MELTREIAMKALEEAHEANPGPWMDHSLYVAKACENIAKRCPHLNAETAYMYGILHDIGRHAGVTSEKRFVDVAVRYGMKPAYVDRWKRVLEIKKQLEEVMGCSIYDCLPGVMENSFR